MILSKSSKPQSKIKSILEAIPFLLITFIPLGCYVVIVGTTSINPIHVLGLLGLGIMITIAFLAINAVRRL